MKEDTKLTRQKKNLHYMCYVWKKPLCNLRTTQVQISLRECAGWSGPSTSAYRINGYCSLCERTDNAQIRLHGWACWSVSSLFAYDIRALFPRWASIIVLAAIDELVLKEIAFCEFLLIKYLQIFQKIEQFYKSTIWCFKPFKIILRQIALTSNKIWYK